MEKVLRPALERPGECIVALLAVLRAACRIGFHRSRASLPDLVSRLKQTGRTPSLDPRLGLAVLEHLLPLLPPYGAGRCMKRSLLLLDLWSRAGLEPRFHLGLRASPEARSGHAWVTTRDEGVRTESPPDVTEAWQG